MVKKERPTFLDHSVVLKQIASKACVCVCVQHDLVKKCTWQTCCRERTRY